MRAGRRIEPQKGERGTAPFSIRREHRGDAARPTSGALPRPGARRRTPSSSMPPVAGGPPRRPRGARRDGSRRHARGCAHAGGPLGARRPAAGRASRRCRAPARAARAGRCARGWFPSGVRGAQRAGRRAVPTRSGRGPRPTGQRSPKQGAPTTAQRRASRLAEHPSEPRPGGTGGTWRRLRSPSALPHHGRPPVPWATRTPATPPGCPRRLGRPRTTRPAFPPGQGPVVGWCAQGARWGSPGRTAAPRAPSVNIASLPPHGVKSPRSLPAGPGALRRDRPCFGRGHARSAAPSGRGPRSGRVMPPPKPAAPPSGRFGRSPRVCSARTSATGSSFR